MAFDNSFTAVTGATLAAGDWNTAVKGNWTASWVGTTAGDLNYYSSATAKSRLALGAAHTFLKSEGGSAPLYGALVYKRKGGHATIWETPGTTIYTPSKTLIQVVTVSVSFTSGVGSQAITYPENFTERPAVYPAANNTGADFIVNYSDNSISGCTIRVRNVGGGNGSVDVVVLLVGG